MPANTAWRIAMIVPAVLFLICAATMKLLCWDTPTAKRFDVSVTGKTQKPSLWDYVVVLKDIRVIVMIFQYSACFGTELAMNNQLATHFRTYFQMDAADASALAGAFGLMNLFARSLGGITSDILFKYVGFRGRIWAQFLALFFEAVFLFLLWYGGQLAAMVCCLGRADLFLPLCPDGRRYKLRDCAFHEQAAAGRGVCTGWGWRKFGSCYRWVLLLQTHQRSAASFPGPCRLCHVLGFAVPLLLLA